MVYINDIYRKTPSEPEPKESGKNKGKSIKAFVTFILVLIMLYLGYILVKSLDLKPIDKNTEISNIETSPEPSETNTATVSPTPEPSNTAQPSPAPQAIDKNSISIKVLNGSGKTGAASAIKTELENKGFTVAATGTANNSYSQSIIYYKTDINKSKAELVQKSLTSVNCLLQKSSVVGTYDVLVVVGKK